MKKIIAVSIGILLIAVIPHPCQAQTSPAPIILLMKAIPAGQPVEETEIMRDFLTQLHGDEKESNNVAERIKNEGAKQDVFMTYKYGINHLEFTVLNAPNTGRKTILWLTPHLGDGITTVTPKKSLASKK